MKKHQTNYGENIPQKQLWPLMKILKINEKPEQKEGIVYR